MVREQPTQVLTNNVTQTIETVKVLLDLKPAEVLAMTYCLECLGVLAIASFQTLLPNSSIQES